MEEDTEVLDWGNEDDEQQLSDLYASQRHIADDRYDAEDAVSLGGDEDDMQDFVAYQTRPPQHVERAQNPLSNPSASLQQQSTQNRDTRDSTPTKSPRKGSPHLRRSQSLSLSKLTHALPPKPVLVDPDFTRPPPTQISTLASSMIRRDRKSNGQSKSNPSSNDANEVLPPDWEIRYPRNGGHEAYYYNVVTFESTWVYPSFISSGHSSPSKDRGSDLSQTARSPRLSNAEGGLPLQADMNGSSRSKREPKRRASPANGGSLSYEDRHYRPNDVTQPAVANDPTDRRDVRASRRSPSPRPFESRRGRSATPPRAGQRRESSLSPVQATRRDAVRDVPSRFSPPPDRSWGRPRSQSPDRLSTVRGRRQRRDGESPEVYATIQEQRFRDDLKDVPTQRHRSPPPYIRESSSPTNTRRSSQAHDTLPPASSYESQGRYARSPSPPPDRGGGRRHDIYIPSDTVPQRRQRDLDPLPADDISESQAKRRRVDDLADATPSRRGHTADYPMRSQANSVPEAPMLISSTHEVEQPRRKRAPLPPQSARFREASKHVPSTPPSGISSLPPPSQYPPVRSPSDLPLPTRPAGFVDVPSGPRNLAQDSDRSSRQPPTKPLGRRGTRFGDTPQGSGQIRDSVATGHPRIEEPPSRPASMYSDRSANEVQTDSTLPKGPRAMTQGNTGPYAQSATGSSLAPYVNARAGQDSRMRQRALPPHLVTGADGRRDRVDLPPTTPKGPAAGNAQAGPPFRRSGGQTESSEQKRQNAKESSGRRGPPTQPKLSGTNSVPIGNRRSFPPENPPEPARSAHSSPVERYLDNGDQASRYQDGYPRSYPSDKESPNSYPRPLQPISDSRRRSQGVRDDHMEVEPVPLESYVTPVTQRREPTYETDRPRQSRFGSQATLSAQGDRSWRAPDEVSEATIRRNHPSQSPVINESYLPSSQGPPSSAWSTPFDDEPKRYSQRVANSDRHYEPPPQHMDIDDAPRSRENRQKELSSDRPKGRHSPAETRPRSRSNALEARLSSQHESRPHSTLPAPPASLPPRPKDTYHDEPRRVYDDSRGESRTFREPENRPPLHWDRSPDLRNEPVSAPPRVNPERLRHVESRLPSNKADAEQRRDSKPVRIRRPVRSPVVDDTRIPAPLEARGNGNPLERDGRGSDSYDDKGGRGIGRGGSLLDRLALDSPSSAPSASTPSLRDRVDIPMKRGNDDLSDLAAIPMAGANLEGEGEASGKGGRSKRRNGKSRRGRKSAAP